MATRIFKLTEEQILNTFEYIFSESKLSNSKSDFYCGITDDLDRRAKEHNIKKYCFTLKLQTFEDAKEIEKQLSSIGFDCGNQLGNGNEKSVYVYMCYKDSEFKK